MDSIKIAILEECHDSIFAGHLGKDKTIDLVQRLFVWKGMHKEITDYCTQCETCQRAKPGHISNQGLLTLPGQSEVPWHRISVDFITCFPDTSDGHDSILTIVDRCTKMVILVPTTITVTAEDFAQLMTDHCFKIHGIPLDILSDRDPRFTGHFWATVSKIWNIHPSITTAYHPQSDGQTERVNRSVEQVLRAYALEFNIAWDKTLSMVEFAINNSKHASLLHTPFFLNTGRNPLTPLMAEIIKDDKAKCARAFQFTLERQQVLDFAMQQIKIARDRYKSYADANRKDVVFHKDDLVLLSTVNINKHSANRKLYPKFLGPFKISAVVNDTAYRLELPLTLNIHKVFHVSLLKAWVPSKMTKPPPPPIEDKGELTYVIERIVDHRDVKTSTNANKKKVPKVPAKHTAVYKREYYVKWLGYTSEHNTWEPEEHLKHAPEYVEEYFDTKKLLESRRAKRLALQGQLS